MVNARKRVIVWIVVVLLYLSTWAVDFLDRSMMGDIFVDFFNIYENLVCYVLLAYWTYRIFTRFQKGVVRRLLLAIAGLIFFFITFKNIKYYVASDYDYDLNRYLWYLYYIPMLGIPLCSFFIGIIINKPEGYKFPKALHSVAVLTVALIVLVLTNDLHQWVFHFNETPWTDKVCSYRAGYIVIYVWIIALLVSFVVLLIKGCRLEKKLKLYLPILPMLLGGAVFLLVTFGINNLHIDIAMLFSFLTVASLELAMYNGLIRINTGYEQLFKESGLNALIVDEGCNIKYKGKNALSLDKETIIKARDGDLMLNKDTVLKSQKLTYGSLLWSEDITEYNAYLEKLKENKEALQYQLSIEQENYQAKESLNALSEKNEIMDTITRECAPKLQKVMNLLNSLPPQASHKDKRAVLGLASLITTYIKRKSNLVLLAMNNGVISSDELRLSIEESLMTLKIRGMQYAVVFNADVDLSKEDTDRCFDLYEAIVEENFKVITDIVVRLRAKGDTTIFTITALSDEPLKEYLGVIPTEDSGEYTYTVVIGGERHGS